MTGQTIEKDDRRTHTSCVQNRSQLLNSCFIRDTIQIIFS